jgi:protein-tyrosine phosphatase
MRHVLMGAGLTHLVEVDSAGTAGYHSGELPDSRARAAGRRFGVEVGGRARQFKRADFERFDYVLAMDQANYDDLRELAPSAEAREKVHLLRSFDPGSPRGASVPDPYYGDDEDFDDVVRICQAACSPLLKQLRQKHRLGSE